MSRRRFAALAAASLIILGLAVHAAAATITLSNGASCTYSAIAADAAGNVVVQCQVAAPPAPTVPTTPAPPQPAGDRNLESKDVGVPGGFDFCSSRPVMLSWSALGPRFLTLGLMSVTVDGRRIEVTAFGGWQDALAEGCHSVRFGLVTIAQPITLRVDTRQQ